MGYTHYFTTKNILDADKFKTYSEDMKKVTDTSYIKIAFDYDEVDTPPEITPELVRFNGIGNYGHETFFLSRTTVGFEFCKTANKPYDIVVVAALAVAKDIFGDDISISSDGNQRNWVDGINLANVALGRTINNPIMAESTA